jgi:hypothetical protein
MKRTFFALVALALASTSALASNSSAPVQIAFISYTNTGIVTVYVTITQGTNAPIVNIPACVSPHNIGNTYDYVFDSTTPAGKSLLTGLTAFKTAGINIWVTGTGDCGVVGGNETLQAFHNN